MCALNIANIEELAKIYPGVEPPVIWVRITEQKLYLFLRDTIIVYPVSTGKAGVGNEMGSGKTPLGKHKIIQKVGEGAPIGTVFKNLENTGKIILPTDSITDEDPIITRVLVLEGLEEGVNRGVNKNGKIVDSRKRCIYIHGTPKEDLIGTPASKGCIRMKNKDIVELFSLIPEGTEVFITE